LDFLIPTVGKRMESKYAKLGRKVWGRNEKDFRSDRTSARKMYAMRECMLKHDIG
jgi:hypothetical protein